MPLLKRKPFEKDPNTHQALKDNQEVFYCELSKEIFVDYEEYFERTMLFNSTIWTCAVSGRPNLTYAEALESEKKHRKMIEAFPQVLKGPVVYIANLTKRSAISDLVDDVFNYVNTRFFKNEKVIAKDANTEQYVECEVVGFVTSVANEISPNGKIQTEDVKYRVKRIEANGKSPMLWTVNADQIRRSKKNNSLPFSKDKLKLFLKQCIEYNDIRMLTIKQDAYKKYVTDANITSLSSFYVGKQPIFDLSKVLADKKEKDKKKKQEQKKTEKKQKKSLENGTAKNGTTAANKNGKVKKSGKQSSLDDFVTKDGAKIAELKKQKKLEDEEAKRRKEEENRKRKEMEAERMKLLAEERKKRLADLMQLVQVTVRNLNAVKDDLELQDQKPLPVAKPVRTVFPEKYFSDAVMVIEFISSYTDILEDKDKFRNGIDFSLMERALLAREVAGPLSDILQVLLGSIFSLQIEEANEIDIEYESGPITFKDNIPSDQQELIKSATVAATWPQKYLSMNMSELPIDATTLTELLRLHFLTSGAKLTEIGSKYRFQERGGFQNTDDPGVMFCVENPHILKALSRTTVYELPMDDIIAILRVLINQILSYSSVRDMVEERLESSSKAKMALKNLLSAERKRESQFTADKKEVFEEIKKALETFEGTEEEKIAHKETLDKKADLKIKNLEFLAEREKKKFTEQLEKLKREIFDYQLCLGSDRAYRTYWLFESLPGLFIEHDTFGGLCIENPVTNMHGLANCPPEKRYLFIKNMLQEQQNNNLNDKDKENKVSNTMDVKPKTNDAPKLPENGSDAVAVAVAVPTQPQSQSQPQPQPQSQTPLPSLPPLPPLPSLPPLPPLPSQPPVQPEINYSQRDLFMCTGDYETCRVHNVNDKDRVTWSFLHTEEEINALIDSLNPRGYREKILKEQLESQRELILYHTKKCPVDKLQVDPETIEQRMEQIINDKSKAYSNANLNYPKGTNISDMLLTEIRSLILELEFKVTTGQLGTMAVKDRMAWRSALEAGSYDMQANNLQWGPFGQFQEDSKGKMKTIQQNGKVSVKTENPDDENDDDEDDKSSLSNLKYEDPGTFIIDKDEEMTAESEVQYKQIHGLACALLQIAQAIEVKYFKPPYGNLKSGGKYGTKEENAEKAQRSLERWQVSLMNSQNASQLFLHYNVLYDAIKWTRSAQNAKCSCRSSKDPDKLLLCDGCNIGRHIYCLKPKLTKVPEGDWFCSRCKPNQEPQPQKKKRQAFVYTEEDDEEEEEGDDEEEAQSDEDDEEDEDEEDDEEEEDDSQSMYDSPSDSNYTDKKVCARCNKTNRNLFKCSKCDRHFDTKCTNLKSKPDKKWACTYCTDGRNKRRRNQVEDSDSDEEVSAKTPKLNGVGEERRSSRRRAEASPPTNQRLSSSRRSHRGNDDLLLDNVTIHKLLDEVSKNVNAWPFLRPVSRHEVPDYHKVIKNPMDLAKVKSKLNTGQYTSNGEVMKDIQLIFANCDLYNQNESEIYVAGAQLETYIVNRCKELNLQFVPSEMAMSLCDDSSSKRKRQKM